MTKRSTSRKAIQTGTCRAIVTVIQSVSAWSFPRFKEINDIFGYTNADTLLKRIAEQLTTSSFFPHGVAAFRAHGDEFYLAGALLGYGPVRTETRSFTGSPFRRSQGVTSVRILGTTTRARPAPPASTARRTKPSIVPHFGANCVPHMVA